MYVLAGVEPLRNLTHCSMRACQRAVNHQRLGETLFTPLIFHNSRCYNHFPCLQTQPGRYDPRGNQRIPHPDQTGPSHGLTSTTHAEPSRLGRTKIKKRYLVINPIRSFAKLCRLTPLHIRRGAALCRSFTVCQWPPTTPQPLC
jgi:hypothetical protein